MKIKHITAALLACTLGVTSCDLNISPDSYIAEDFFFEDESQVNTAVIGCYSGIHDALYYEWALTELRADNTRLNRSKTTTEANLQLLALDQGVMNSSNLNIRNYWEAVYKNINNCNTVLHPANLDVIANPDTRSQFEGEALFIRSYHYFNLVQLFGPIFIVTEKITVEQSMKKDRSTVEEVYEQIITDLTTSIEKLSDVTYAEEDLGRVTELAPKALLAKVYLTQKEYSKAEPLLKSIIAVKGKTLIPYKDVFDVNKEMNDEIIFAVRYLKGNKGIGSPFANKFAPLNSSSLVVTGNGDGQNYPTTDLIESYEATDVRKDISLAENYIDESKPNPIINEAYIKKFLSPVTAKYDAENDWPVIRYADVILMYAEVLNELEGITNALEYLNLTRERANLPKLTEEEINTKYAFRTALEKERRLEFAFENHRWFDLLRWGKAKETVNTHIHTLEWAFYSEYSPAPSYIQDYQLILPIPQSVIDINGGVITQNPNY